MGREDAQFTKLTADLINVARGFCDYGEGKGLITPDGLKFAITRRKEVVKQLADAGMSQRDIASTLGVGATTVNRDLNGAPKRNDTVPKRNAEQPDQEEEISPDDYRGVFRLRAEQAKSFAESCRHLVGEMDAKTLTKFSADLLRVASATADAWTELTQELRR